MNRLAFAVGSLMFVALGCGGTSGSGRIETVDANDCASGKRWAGGDHESELMHPGMDCIACHAREHEGPTYTAAGTVYAGSHEADDCFGVAGVQVELTDADGVAHTLTTNEAGNFFTEDELPLPYTVRVLSGGKVNQMIAAQSTGACASCHTQEGANAAPGRVLAP